MAISSTKPVARIIDEIEYPDMFMEGLVITAVFSLNGRKFGRTISVADSAPDEAIRFAVTRFAEEVIKTKNTPPSQPSKS